MLLSDLAKRIRSQREKRGLKQQDVANALNVSPQAVSKWERGENAPDIAVLTSLTKLLGVSVDWLLGAHEEARDVFEGSVLVTSVSGAYEKSLHMRARDFAIWANGLFYQLTEVTLRHDGIPVKYMGDQYLAFYSGSAHRERAVAAALQSKALVGEGLRVGLSSGEIYLGSVGHPDYARPDIMGQTVNIAFLTVDWAQRNTKSGIAAPKSMLADLSVDATTGKGVKVNFLGIERPVEVCEVIPGANVPKSGAKQGTRRSKAAK
ncbi:MAG: helix-turn-helix domain-containing protein [Candidatus Hydrogenedentes bacterium]|nr:helix-turn-helix domain-containing protein [Candidatus Hydrogenedentota bacterium]